MEKPGGAQRLLVVGAVAAAAIVLGLVALFDDGGGPAPTTDSTTAAAPAKIAEETPKPPTAASAGGAAAPAKEPEAATAAAPAEGADAAEAPADSAEQKPEAREQAATGESTAEPPTAEPAAPETLAKAVGEAPNHAPEASDAPGAETADTPVPAPPAPVSAPKPEAAPVAPAPEFDIVRIERSGAGLVAGRAPADSVVRITNDGVVVGEAIAGADGAFVAYIQIDPAARAQGVSAQVLDPGEAGDADKPPAPEAAPLVVLAGASPDSAPVIVQPDDDGVRMVQPALAPSDEVTLDSISYDEAGRVVFAGRGSTGVQVRFYLDGQPVGGAPVADDRSWRGQATERLAPGVYTLAVEEANAAGKVVSRLETPFRRELIEQGALGQNRLTVQRGNSLWRIARKVYGEGVRYTLIFEANADKIENPDLIYPGQIFTIPDAN